MRFCLAGLMTAEEEKILKVISGRDRTEIIRFSKFSGHKDPVDEAKVQYNVEDCGESHKNVYYVPLLWASEVVNYAYAHGRVKDPVALQTLLEACSLRGL